MRQLCSNSSRYKINECIELNFNISDRIKNIFGDFPGGAVVKNPPANAGDHRFNPWSRKIPHAAGQLSPCATTTELAL